jgi:hypothetical protein
MGIELTRLCIAAFESSLTCRIAEEEKAKRLREYTKKKLKLFEDSFDDELVDVGKAIGEFPIN